ncbi:unnamed protein product [Closterium sp. Naga37s-1]|nr:unnamed protein product [Closterium sp. Naga37s-1]
MHLLQGGRDMGETLANPDHAPLPAKNDQVRLAEAGETRNEGEGIRRQGRGRAEPEDTAAEEDHPVDLQTVEAAYGQEAREVPHLQPPAAEEPEEEAREMTAERESPVGREGVAAPMAPRAMTPQAQTIADGTTGEMQTGNATATTPGDGDRTSEAGARRSHAEQREGVEADGDPGRSRHEPGDVDGSSRGESDRRPPRARPGQRRLGAGLAPARPGPVSGWEQQEDRPGGPTGRRTGACPSSQRDLHAQGGEGEENRTADQLEENDEDREEEVIATVSAAWQRQRNETNKQRALREQEKDRARGQQPRNAAGSTATRGRRRGRGKGGRVGELARSVAREKARSGNWRERHGRPEEQNAEPMNDPPEEEESEYMGEEEAESEEVSVEAEDGVPAGNEGRRRRGGRRGREGRNPDEAGQVGESPAQQANEAASKERSPNDIADDEDTWRAVASWDLDPLRASSQPFLFRKLPPEILKSYSHCLTIPLL